MRLLLLVQASLVRFSAVALTFLVLPGTVLANSSTAAVQGAANDVGPAIPEPSSIFLFLAGVAIVGWGVQRRRRRSS